MPTVAYIYRCPQPEFHSIEELFGVVARNLPGNFSAHTHSVPAPGATPAAMLRNCTALRKVKADIKHITGHVNYVGCVLGGNTILTVHDVRSLLYRNVLGNLVLKLFWFWLPALRVKYITVVSDFSRRELVRMVPFAKRKIRVVGNPCTFEEQINPCAFNVHQPRILHIGTKPNKNLGRTIAALSDLPCTLVIIGNLSAADKDNLAAANIAYENYFDLTFDQLREQYVRCDIVCFASTYEGFGMPVIEANSLGRPVVAGRLGALPEVAGKAACLVDPFDPVSIRKGVQKVVNDMEYRDWLIEQGIHNARRFAPAAIASQYANVYAELLQSSP